MTQTSRPATDDATPTLARAVLAEGIGTAMLLTAVVGSGIMAATQSPTDAGLQLLEAALATGMALAAIIVAFGPISGAHLNPAVTIADQLLEPKGWGRVGAYIAAQVVGGAIGVMAANLMFDLPAVNVSATARTGPGVWLGEVVATYGLVVIIFLMVRGGSTVSAIGAAVGAYIAGAYFFTSSTSFANPAVTLARTLSDTFAGIDPSSVVAFIAAQAVGTGLAVGSVILLTGPRAD